MTVHSKTRLAIHLTLLLGLLAAGMLLVAGCAKDGSKASGKANKVNCNALCDKTFGTCVNEVLLGSGKMDSKKLAMFKKLGLLKDKVIKPGHDKCLKGCVARKGQFRDSSAVNACLAIKDCKKYATCILKHM